MIICECGHSIEEHAHIGCKHIDTDICYGTKIITECFCNFAPETVEARLQLKKITDERDALRKQLEVAMKALKDLDKFEFTYSGVNWVIKTALAEIARIGEEKR
jgi:hypothetical protein